MLQRGNVTQEDADNYMSLIKQGSLPFGLGNRMFGSDNMNIAGVDMNPEQQRNLLASMEDEIDVLQQGRQKTRKDSEKTILIWVNLVVSLAKVAESE